MCTIEKQVKAKYLINDNTTYNIRLSVGWYIELFAFRIVQYRSNQNRVGNACISTSSTC